MLSNNMPLVIMQFQLVCMKSRSLVYRVFTGLIELSLEAFLSEAKAIHCVHSRQCIYHVCSREVITSFGHYQSKQL